MAARTVTASRRATSAGKEDGELDEHSVGGLAKGEFDLLPHEFYLGFGSQFSVIRFQFSGSGFAFMD